MNRKMPKNEIGVLVKHTIYIRDGVQWTFHKRLPFPTEVVHLVELKCRAKVHRASFKCCTHVRSNWGGLLRGNSH